ncbi:5-oxoprolinase subunit PxpB [Alkalibacillus silvisoli]|uniref:5-oxoprolinase subunit PxpB n=1 Tax=Alkalibacillus silvisoli TaxID=392823 RepID=A0ABP3JGG1_9BACI
MEFTISPLGNQALIVTFGEDISTELHEQVVTNYNALKEADLVGVQGLVPTYRSIAVYYNWKIVNYEDMKQAVESVVWQANKDRAFKKGKTIYLPVCYEEEVAPDLKPLAQYHNMTETDVIKLHSEPTYLVYMIGFLPGFPYVGGLNERLETPRLETPRQQVTSGSVGIAGKQTGVYPITSPGGWNIIGKTPIKLFDPKQKDPALFEIGDQLRFEPVSSREFIQIEQHARIKDFIVLRRSSSAN